MPQNNPGNQGLAGGETVFIDTSLNEIPHHLTHQDIEALVGLNIPSSELEELQDVSPTHVENSGILMSDSVSVSNMIQVPSKEEMQSSAQPMEVDPLPDSAHVLEDLDLLHQTQDLLPINSLKDEFISGEIHSSEDEQLHQSSSHIMSDSMTIKPDPCITIKQESKTQDSLPPQILKTSAGHFVILQPNQGGTSMAPGKIFSSTQFSCSPNSTSLNNISTKPVFVNANQLNTGLKQGLTKVIISNQPGTNLGQQLRVISSHSAMNSQDSSSQNSSGTINSIGSNNNNNNSSKVTLQIGSGPVKLGLANSNLQPVSKTIHEIKPTPKLKMPVTFSVRTSSNSNVTTSLNQNQSVDILQQPAPMNSITPSAKVVMSNPLTQHKVLLKGNIPLSNVHSPVALKPGQILATTAVRLASSQQQQISQPQQQPVMQQHSQLQQTQPQPLQVPNKVNYIRLVNPSSIVPNTMGSSGSGTNQTVVTKSSIATKPIAPATEQNVKIKGLSIPVNQANPKQRLIIPLSGNNAHSLSNNLSNLQIRQPGTITLPASALPAGVLSNAQPGSLVMIPAQYFQNNSNVANNTIIQSSNTTPPVSLSTTAPSKVSTAAAAAAPPPRTVIDANGIKPRKPCNCTKSQCLKLYCDCFANGEFCKNCNCVNCYNNLTHEEDRQKAIRACLERNPQAFRPKIGKGGTESERRHNKGCNCKRSGCLKNYCECYEARIPCSSMCRCVGCRNIDNCIPPERKKFYHLVEPAESKVSQKAFIKNRSSMISSLPSPAKMSLTSGGKAPYCRINQEVVEATCHCLLAQAEKAEKTRTTEDTTLLVINEFSRCLLQIIGCNTKNSTRVE